ncbi:hypothetical protein SLEP1_g2124 [Rubroshorea leprosula]|uniref:Amino acid transporter transmembrane domain-containing protein n=1 Tax=Rubroshorea leprosula TaxID=152421 RepID=A0AAV5HGP0_9ROSI|nr:hypothetical protein SLEP1_g2124 [Rubroshorea leprosula]
MEDDQAASKTLHRTGTVWTASAHIITAVMGSGVLSLAWAVAQLGWILGPAAILLFSLLTNYTLHVACKRCRDPDTGQRSSTYMDAVRSTLGESRARLCGWVQYLNHFGLCIGYTIISATSMMAIKRSDCFHKSGSKNPCHMHNYPYMIAFGIAEIIFSQILDFHQLGWLFIVAAVMSVTYSTIVLGLGFAQVAENGKIMGSLTGISIVTVSPTQKVWKTFSALGDIAFAYSYSLVIIEIQDTIRSPSEFKTMKKASLISVTVATLFYMLCGCMGYAAFGDSTPGNLLTGFGLYNPSWLLDIANVATVILLVGAYQVYCQPLFAFIEKQAAERYPDWEFVTEEMEIPIPGFHPYNLNLFRLVWRTLFVITTTTISILLPYFNHVVGLFLAVGFWPLTIYFPVQMYIKRKKILKRSIKWFCLQVLSISCFIITIATAAGSIVGIFVDLKSY